MKVMFRLCLAIVSFIGASTYSLAKFLVGILSPLLLWNILFKILVSLCSQLIIFSVVVMSALFLSML